jgi:catechol 2,3-dioxygenase-like lactoylglutathione lyase family enzyme
MRRMEPFGRENPGRAVQLVLMNLSHVAMTVPDLEPAEAYYRALFAMEIVTREALGPEGELQLPPDRDWGDARRAGIDLYMVALRVGGFVLALFDEASPAVRDLGLAQYRPLFVGLVMREEDIARVRRRLSDEEWDDDSGGFRDRYGIGWQLSSKRTFVGSGDHSGRWLATG